MAKIASLWVEIGANSAKFSKELKKTNSQSRSWAASLKSTLGKGAGAFAGVGAAVAATTAAINGLYSVQAQYIDDLGKQSAKLGDLTANLQAVRSAADFAGVGAGIDTAMQRLVRGMGDAAKGTGSALKAVEQLGLNAAEIANKTATEQLQTVLDQLQKIPIASERVALSFKFFGKEGVGLVNLTSDAIRSAREELDRWGVTVSEQQVAMVEAANDNISRIGKFGSGFFTQLTAKLAPLINFQAQGMLDWAEATINWGTITNSIISVIKKSWIGLRVSFDAIKLVWVDLKIGFNVFTREILEGLSFLEQKVADLYNLLPGEDIAVNNSAVNRWLEGINGSIAESRQEHEKLAATMRDVWGNGLIGSQYGQQLEAKLRYQQRVAEEARKTQIALQNSLKFDLSTAANDPVASSVVVPFAASTGADLARQYREKQRRLADARNEDMRLLAEQTRAVNSEIDTLANTIGTGIKESATRGSDAIKEMVADILIQFAKLEIQKTTALGGAGSGSATGGILTNMFSGLMGFNRVPTGTDAAADSLRAGASAAGYAPSVINNIHVTASGESSSAVSSLRAGVRQLTEASPQQVATRAMRGGSYSQSFGR